MDRIDVVSGLPFRIGFTGHSGHLRIEPLPPVEGNNPLRSIPDFICPPAFEPETRESAIRYIEDKYLTPLLDPDEFSVERSGRQWQFDWFDRAKVPLDLSTQTRAVVPQWELPFRRQKNSDGIWDPKFIEVDVKELLSGAQDSGQLPRMPGLAKDFVKGGSNSRPFWPGGLDMSQSSERSIPKGARDHEWIHEILVGGHAQTVPPSFKQGLDLGCLKGLPLQWKCAKEQTSMGQSLSTEKLSSLSVTFEDLFKDVLEDNTEEKLEDEGSSLKPEAHEVEVEKFDKFHVEATINSESSLVDKILVDECGLSMLHKNGNSVSHEEASVSIKDISANFYQLVPDMALDFPFELDEFQKEAIYYLEKGESVFVAAHTSAGKTVVAEYAFALASKHCTKAVYTAPIKTISNQKYRDFCGKFDVGLLTGDVSIKPEASCLIMTTEILRSMLYKGADIIRDIEWVIFDEVHYVNDVERGVVWEEIIIMLPKHVNIVLLSATVPNTKEFADWISRTKNKKIHVTGTLKRPIPLEHCIFYSGEFHKICQNEVFLPKGIQAAKDAFKKKNSRIGGAGPSTSYASSQGRGQIKQNEQFSKGRGRGQKHHVLQNVHGIQGTSGTFQGNRGTWGSQSTSWLLLIKKLTNMSLSPVIIFCFSKNQCDKSVDTLIGADFTSSTEKSKIRVFCNKVFTRLKGSDRKLPQIVRVEKILERGIGVHHAGLLPIVKEVVEMLFCRGLIKVLFSTETFAMGVNAPARTVVFDRLRKYDGKEFRSLLPGEYIQMAGRAGRRGLDTVGTVIVMCRDEIPDENLLKNVMVGMPTRLASQFRLRYTMILHLLRLEELKVEDMLKRSFAEFHTQKKRPEIELLLLKLSQSTKAIECIKGEPAIEDYFEMASRAEQLRDDISEVLMLTHTAQQFLTPGRVVIVRSKLVEDHLLGVILKLSSSTPKEYIVLVLTTDMADSTETSSTVYSNLQEKHSGGSLGGYFIMPKGKRNDGDYYSSSAPRTRTGVLKIKLPYRGSVAGSNYEVIGIEPREILSICDCKIKIDQVGLLEEPSTVVYSKTIQELLGKKSQGNKYPPALDPLKDLKLKNLDLVEKYKYNISLLQKMTENKCHGCSKLKEHMELCREQNKHKEEVDKLKYQMSDEALQHMPDFQGRVDVLKEIGCIDSELVVQIKGRVACEMSSGEELICTECLFDNQLEDLDPEEAVALMSAFVFQQKNTSEPNLTPKLLNAKKRLCDTARNLGYIQANLNVNIDPDEYVQDNLKFGLVEVVYEWAKGTPFAEICELTDVPEGLIVRTIVRLDETCREFKNAALIMGNSALHKKMETASNGIKRDIVFAASLYVTGVD